MRLAIATTYLQSKGGMERVVLKIAQRFDASVHCLYYDRQGTYPQFAELDVRPSGKIPVGRLPFGKRIAMGVESGLHFYGLKLSDYDVVNAHTTPSEWVRNRNSPVVWYCHSPNREAYDLYEWRMASRGLLARAAYSGAVSLFRRIEGGTVPKIERIFANSANTSGRIRKYLGRESEILHPGVEPDDFRCREYGKFFFYPSRLAPEKDHGFAIEAFRIFSRKAKGWKLVIAGGEVSGGEKYAAGLQKSAPDGVIIEKDISEERLRGLYSECYAVLYSPINEDFGLVPLEGMAACKPCITKDEGGPRETVEEGKDGFLVKSPEQMAEKMLLLVEDGGRCERMGKAGRKKVLERFTWEIFLERFGKVAKEVADGKNE